MRSSKLRNEVFLREDINSVLRAVDKASYDLAEHLPVHEVTVYRAGFVAAIEAVALAFDVEAWPHSPNRRPTRVLAPETET